MRTLTSIYHTLILTLLAAGVESVFAENVLPVRGSPMFSVFDLKDGGARSGINSLSLDRLGRILVTSGPNLIAFDGSHWTTYTRSSGGQLGDAFVLYATALGPDGTLYCSSNEGLHRVAFLADDKYELIELAPMDAYAGRGMISLRSAIARDHRILFFGQGSIFEWDTIAEKLTFISPATSSVGALASHHGEVYNFGVDGDAFRLSGGQWDPIPGKVSEVFQEGIRVARSWPGRGLFAAPDISGLMSLAEDGMRHWPSEIDTMDTHRVLAIEPLTSDRLAVSIDNRGVFVLDPQGRVVQALDRSVDFRFGQLRRLLHVGHGALWAASDASLIRIDLLAPLSDFGITLPYARTYPRIFWHHGALHVVSDEKLVRATRFEGGGLRGFERRGASIPHQIINATSAEDGILIATIGAVYFLGDDDTAQRVADAPQCTLILRHTEFPDLAVAVGGDAYRLLRREQGKWVDTGQSQPSPGFSYDAIEDKDGVFWLELGPARVARLQMHADGFSVQTLDEQDGLGPYWINIWKAGDAPIFNASPNREMLEWDAARELLVPTARAGLDELFGHYAGVARPTYDDRGNIWVPTNANHPVLRPQSDGSYFHDTRTLSSVRDGILMKATHTGEGVVWLTGESKIYQYNPRFAAEAAPRPQTRIFAIESVNRERSLFSDDRPSVGHELAFPFADNHLRIKVATPTIAYASQARHQYFIDGITGSWVTFPEGDQLTLSNLREGQYTLRVRPVFETEVGSETAISFAVRPPFFRTWLAYALYIALILALFLAVVLALRKLAERKNRLLQHLVKLRTRELELANRELTQLVGKAESATLAKTAFLHNVSHEMRTPLNGIIGPTSLLMREARDDSTLGFLGMIKSSADRLLKIIEELLIFTENEAYSDASAVNSFNVNELAKELEAEFAAAATEKGLQMDITVDPRMPRFWSGDLAKLRQALRILLENAVKFTQEGEVALRVSFEPGQQERCRVSFEVSDTGPGIDSELKQRLFEPFQQGDDPMLGKHDGTGLGLAICHQLAVAMDGEIECITPPDGGCLFRLTVPLDLRLGAARAAPTESTARSSRAG